MRRRGRRPPGCARRRGPGTWQLQLEPGTRRRRRRGCASWRSWLSLSKDSTGHYKAIATTWPAQTRANPRVPRFVARPRPPSRPDQRPLGSGEGPTRRHAPALRRGSAAAGRGRGGSGGARRCGGGRGCSAGCARAAEQQRYDLRRPGPGLALHEDVHVRQAAARSGNARQQVRQHRGWPAAAARARLRRAARGGVRESPPAPPPAASHNRPSSRANRPPPASPTAALLPRRPARTNPLRGCVTRTHTPTPNSQVPTQYWIDNRFKGMSQTCNPDNWAVGSKVDTYCHCERARPTARLRAPGCRTCTRRPAAAPPRRQLPAPPSPHLKPMYPPSPSTHPYPQLPPSDWEYKDGCQGFSQSALDTWQRGLTNCLTLAFELFDEVLISPHLDDGTRTGHWCAAAGAGGGRLPRASASVPPWAVRCRSRPTPPSPPNHNQ
jgi:hypothetical protein